MKKTIFILALISFIFTNFVQAKCSDWSTEFYPSNSFLTSKGIIVFKGYGGAFQIVNGLGKEYPVFMQSGNHKVALKIKEIYRGFNTLQAVLEPTEPLKVGEEYEFIVENYKPIDEFHNIQKYNQKTIKYEKPIWKIVENSKNEGVKNETIWQKLPTVKEKKFTAFGCGPSVHVIFSTKIKSNSGYYVKATLTNTKTKYVSSYLFNALYDETIAIGHGMCSGEFGFGIDKDFSIVFDLVDLEGKSMKMETKPITFEAPVEKSR